MRYRLLARAVFDGALREPGEEVEWDGDNPGPHMVPVDEPLPPPPPPTPRPPAASPPRSER